MRVDARHVEELRGPNNGPRVWPTACQAFDILLTMLASGTALGQTCPHAFPCVSLLIDLQCSTALRLHQRRCFPNLSQLGASESREYTERFNFYAARCPSVRCRFACGTRGGTGLSRVRVWRGQRERPTQRDPRSSERHGTGGGR